MSTASTRPRDVALASVLTIIGSVLALAGIFGAQGELRSSSVRRQLEELLTDERFATINLSVDALLNVIEYGLMAAAAASVAAIVLAVFVMRGHNPSRIALTMLGGLATVTVLFTGLAGVVIAIFVAYTVSLLWRAPVRSWFAGASAPEGSQAGAGRSGAYWSVSGAGSGGTGSGGPGSGDAGPGAGGPGAGGQGGVGSGGEPEPWRNPDAVPDPEPHWPSDPAQPGSGPGPYPQPWPPEPEQHGRRGQHGYHGQQGHPGQPGQHGWPGAPQAQHGEQGAPEHPEVPGQPGETGQPGQQPEPGYPGPASSEQQPGYGYPPRYPAGYGQPSGPGQTYPAAGQGRPGAHGYPGGYPSGGYPHPSSYYGYPPASGDPYRRPGQVVAAHVLTWVGAAFGLLTGVFFVVAANSTEVINLVEEQFAAGDIDRGQFTAMLIAAGIVSALWSLAVVVVSVFSWRGQNWAAILLTVMGAGYLLVQLFTLLTGQIPVLFTIVWVAAVLTLLWWPASRQWYAAQRAGRPGSGPRGPQGPYGPSGPGSPYPQSPPPHRNQPW